MKKMAYVTSLLLLAACNPEPPRGGTGVGNPGSTLIATALARDATLGQGGATLSTLELSGCDGAASALVSVDAEVDLLSSVPIPIDPGEWCGFVASFEPPMLYEGTTADGGTFTLELAVDAIVVPLPAPLTIDETILVTELGYPGWVKRDELGLLGPGEHRTVQVGDPLHDVLVARLSAGSALYLDGDEDGEVDDDERDEGPVGEGDDREEDEEEDDDA